MSKPRVIKCDENAYQPSANMRFEFRHEATKSKFVSKRGDTWFKARQDAAVYLGCAPEHMTWTRLEDDDERRSTGLKAKARRAKR